MRVEALAASTGAPNARAARWLPHIESAMREFDVSNGMRQAAFLAQIGHESGGLYYTAEIWGPTKSQSRYEGRKDLGNTQPGDGRRFKGRGLIQITGRENYSRFRDALGVDIITQPELLEGEELAARSAAWFFCKHGLNELADTGDFEKITRVINGGLNGYAQRLALYEKAKSALGVA